MNITNKSCCKEQDIHRTNVAFLNFLWLSCLKMMKLIII